VCHSKTSVFHTGKWLTALARVQWKEFCSLHIADILSRLCWIIGIKIKSKIKMFMWFVGGRVGTMVYPQGE
jgi:hypothetical protein